MVSKSAQVASFHQDHQGDDRTDAGQRPQALIVGLRRQQRVGLRLKCSTDLAELKIALKLQPECPSAQADRLMQALLDAMTSGPLAFQAFIESQEQRKQAAASALKAKLDNALRAGRKSERRWGEAIKFCAGVKFVSTVTVKTLGVSTGWAGSGIDLLYGGATDAANPMEAKGILAVGADAAKGELIEQANELIAEHGLMSAVERRQIEGWLGNYEGNAKKISEQLQKIEERLLRQIQECKGIGGIVAGRAKKLAKLRKLRLDLAGKALRSAGSYKKALGKTASFVFLAQGVAEAWGQLEKECALAER